MGIHSIRVPDIGEGIAETEVAEWLVSIGQQVREDDPLAALMTDKATVEVPSPVSGKVIWLAAAEGDTLAVGAELIRLEVDGAGNVTEEDLADDAPAPAEDAAQAETPPEVVEVPARAEAPTEPPVVPAAPLRPEGERPLAPPSVRARAREAGVDLRQVRGSGPAGRITQDDLSAYIASGGVPVPSGARPDESVEEIKVIGLRRRISERMETANRIPHITIVEEVDTTALEDLRGRMNAEGGSKLTVLPFLVRAMVRALRDQPMLNAHYDTAAGVVRRFGGVHVGIAAQTDGGLMVPVLRHAEALTLREAGAEIARLADAVRDGSARREELTGSTITITSLGKLGALATTPILNAPEVAIVGVNRMEVRPFWNGSAFEPRKMMNISCSFDHRVIDGWDAAVFVQRLKTLLETPALIFVES
ncbi:dihydrolipoamide acetyltransferase family protein [Aquicoccus sp. SU-CL01552]|uniref:dihydrolipoamide acetyltransferase family protein n=1 Tax=Aquicoccus sp. SU-CL01552 TaxID=3127656 RepID=UPI00310A42CA